MTRVGYRLDVLVRLAEIGHRRAACSFAAAAAVARSHADRAARLAELARALRDAATMDADTGAYRTVDARRRSDAHVRLATGRAARVEDDLARASDLAVLANARVAERRRELGRASCDARLQEALRDAAMSRMNAERQRREARRANADALDAWCARRIADDD